MNRTKELTELRGKDPQALLLELDREQRELAKNRIAVKLGKFSKIHEIANRKARIARIFTVLGEKVRPLLPDAKITSPNPVANRGDKDKS